MIRTHVAKDGTRSYGVRIHRGGGRYQWAGSFPTLREARRAEAEALTAPHRRDVPTCAECADRFLARYERSHKQSSVDTARAALRLFAADFADRPLTDVRRVEAIDYAERVRASRLPLVVTMFNAAVDAELIDRNPFRGLGRRTRGRSDERPPTAEELGRLLDACAVHGAYGLQMRALIAVGAYSGMRPGEMFALEWRDIDFKALRIDVRRRVYKGRLDLPKSGRPRRIALTPTARDALLTLPRDGELVFRSKTGRRMAQSTLSGYWSQVTARAGLSFDFYMATKHYAVHYLYAELGLPPWVIAEQMGWQLAAVLKLLAVYGHGDVGALEEIDRAFGGNVVQLRDIGGAHGD